MNMKKVLLIATMAMGFVLHGNALANIKLEKPKLSVSLSDIARQSLMNQMNTNNGIYDDRVLNNKPRIRPAMNDTVAFCFVGKPQNWEHEPLCNIQPVKRPTSFVDLMNEYPPQPILSGYQDDANQSIHPLY